MIHSFKFPYDRGHEFEAVDGEFVEKNRALVQEVAPFAALGGGYSAS